MLKELIEGCFFVSYPPRAGVLLNILESSYSGFFSLSDPEACQNCTFCVSNFSNRENIKIKSNGTLSAVRVTQVVSYIKDSVGATCDYLLSGDNVVVLLEMTCSEDQYVKLDKRRYAKKQLVNTKTVFMANPIIRSFFLSKEKRYAVFSWKDTTATKDTRDTVERSFSVFDDFAREFYSADNVQMMDDGFLLKEIRYPDVFYPDK